MSEGKNSSLKKESVEEELEKIVELSLLYDFYGGLLKEHKQKILEDYILNDYSLSEIAKEEGISRQAVYDVVKRGSRELKEYEEKLHLMEKFRITKEKIVSLEEHIRQMKEIVLKKDRNDSGLETLFLQSEEMISGILEGL